MDRKIALVGVMAIATAVSAASLGTAAWLYARVSEYEKTHGVNILSPCAGQKPEKPGKPVAQGNARKTEEPAEKGKATSTVAATVAATNAVQDVAMSVRGVKYNGETELRVALSARPESSSPLRKLTSSSTVPRLPL